MNYDLNMQDARREGIEIGREQERLKLQDARREGIEIGMERGKEYWIDQGMQRGKKRWMQQGIEQGMQQGIHRGKKQGMEQERNKIISILDYDNIGLSDEQKKIILAEFSRSAD